jgi:hypothetical protein
VSGEKHRISISGQLGDHVVERIVVDFKPKSLKPRADITVYVIFLSGRAINSDQVD